MNKSNKTSILIDNAETESYLSTATQDIWLYDKEGEKLNNFASPTHKNNVKAYVQSHEYYQDLISAFKQAEQEIYITGWQVNWDAILSPEIRLIDLLLDVVNNNHQLKVYILPWKARQIDTGDIDSLIVLRNYINEYTKRDAIAFRLHSSENDVDFYKISSLFFSHHQKCIIIDRKKAFLGGIDLAYGRYSKGYELDPKADNRHALNKYNPCVALMDDNKKEKILSFDVKRYPSLELNWVKYYQQQVFTEKRWQPADSFLADNQPIMPWQDIQVMITGKAVSDLVTNFVLRWNSASNGANNDNTPKNMSYDCIYRTLKLQTQEEYDSLPDDGNISIQILRSAPKDMCNLENGKTNLLKIQEYLNHKSPKLESKYQFNIQRRAQSDIYQVMLQLIKRAKRFIYLENQFFISEYGKTSPSSNNEKLSIVAKSIDSFSPWATTIGSFSAKEPPKNTIVKALAEKIEASIFAYQPTPFHIYITLPVHPEGLLNSGNIIDTIHHTMQTISFGSDSLLNRIRKQLWVYQQLIKDDVPRKEWNKLRPQYYDKMEDQYQTIPIEACDKYVTLLNLRSWAELDGRTVTEQIYVHSKLTIVDDLYVLVGSANINDRSLLGSRDSELAALIVDNDAQTVVCHERGIDLPVRTFAYDLRQKIWSGLFDQGLEDAIKVPELASSVTAIQSRARQNSEIFEAVFPFIPRNYLSNKLNYYTTYKTYASIWPVVDYEMLTKIQNQEWDAVKDYMEQFENSNKDYKMNSVEIDKEATFKTAVTNLYFHRELMMPFNTIFWQNYTINQKAELTNIKGHITLVPIHWTQEENNFLGYHNRLIT